MLKLFRYLKKAYVPVIAIVLFLVVQASCDLTLPTFTSNIVNVGIQQKGIEDAVPDVMREETFLALKSLMKQDDADDMEDAYKLYTKDQVKDSKYKDYKDGRLYVRRYISKKDREHLDTSMSKAMLKLSAQMAKQIQANPQAAASLSKSQKKMMAQMKNMDTKDMPDTIISQAAISFVTSEYKAIGLDIDQMQTHYLLVTGAKMIGLAFLIMAAAVSVTLLSARLAAKLSRILREKVFEKVMSFTNSEFDKFSTASLITRSTNDIQQIQMFMTMVFRIVVYAPLMGIGGIFKVLTTNAKMTWTIAIGVIAIMLVIFVLFKVAMPKFKILQKLIDRLNLVTREILTGLSVIRAFGREKTEEERFDEANKKLTGTQLFTNRIMTFMMPGMMFIMYSVTILITWVSAQKIDAGTLQVGAMTAFITYAMQIVMAFLMMTAMSIMVPRAGVAADRIDEVLKTEASVQNVKKPETLKEHKGVLEFSHVDFKYPGAEHNVLSDIDFKVEPGKTTAIIGSTGCGKSTLVNLIPRFYDVTGGQITLDGKDIRRISMEELREEIGFVPQKGVLFSGKIASNLRFGKADATYDDIKEAAEIAQATEFIETKKEKYDSPIAQGGSNVSGGQKQRLAIARAIAKKAKVLVFDDSFSALDMKTDAALRKELNEKVQDASIVIVAQRVSTILHADQILVLDDGMIVGKGTHEELLKNCEVYLQIAKSQLSEKELGLEKLGLAEEKVEKETNKKEILSTKIDEKENNKLKKKSDDRKLKHKKGGK